MYEVGRTAWGRGEGDAGGGEQTRWAKVATRRVGSGEGGGDDADESSISISRSSSSIKGES